MKGSTQTLRLLTPRACCSSIRMRLMREDAARHLPLSIDGRRCCLRLRYCCCSRSAEVEEHDFLQRRPHLHSKKTTMSASTPLIGCDDDDVWEKGSTERGASRRRHLRSRRRGLASTKPNTLDEKQPRGSAHRQSDKSSVESRRLASLHHRESIQ